MSSFNTKYILTGDDKNEILSKINRNFHEVSFNGVGEKGPIGEIGATGIIGQAGRDGILGATGERASKWFFNPTEPSASLAQDDDFWINIGPTGAQQVYVFQSGSWVYTGETLLSTNIFSLIPGVSGPGGAADDNAVVINGSPGDYSLVLSDAIGYTGSVNPNFSKLLISTDSSQPGSLPILGMSKTFIPQENIPGFYWELSSGASYGLIWENRDNFTYASRSIVAGSTGGSVSINSSNVGQIYSIGSMAINSGTSGGGGTVVLNSSSNPFSISSSNLSVNSSNAIVNSSASAGATGAQVWVNSVYGTSGQITNVTSPSSGLYVKASNTSTSGNPVVEVITLNGTSGNTAFGVRGGGTYGYVQIGGGNTTKSGSALVKDVEQVTSTLSTTFTRNGYTNNYVSISPSSADVVVINPINTSAVYANGETDRFFLSVGTNYGFVGTSSGKERTIDVFVNSGTSGFGGLRVRPIQGSDQYVDIPDAQNTGSSPGKYLGCKRIQLTFPHNDAYLYYKAFSTNGGFGTMGTGGSPQSNAVCGKIKYDLADLAGDPGLGLGLGGF